MNNGSIRTNTTFYLYFFFFFLLNFSVKGQFSQEINWKNEITDDAIHIIVGDFNGDRLSDIAYYTSYKEWRVRLSAGAGHYFMESYSVQSNSEFNSEAFVGDFNGDGLSDKVRWDNKPYPRWHISHTRQYYDRGFEFVEDMTLEENKVKLVQKTLVGDFNGDGISDIAYFYNGYAKCNVFVSSGIQYPISFVNSTWNFKVISSDTNPELWAGDFDGDGKTDILRLIKPSVGAKNGEWAWGVSLSESTSFANEVIWGNLQQISPQYVIVGDFNGDSKCDLAFYSAAGNWYIRLSSGTSFESSEHWQTGAAINDGVFAGDFDGDGFVDKVSWVKSPNNYWGGYWVSTSKNEVLNKVGIYYTTIFHADINYSSWHMDPNKLPVVGWDGNNNSTGHYSSQSEIVIEKQIHAMKKAGIDFIITDNSNGLLPISPGYTSPNIGDGLSTNGTIKLFEVMKRKSVDERLPIAIMLGTEFWGETSFDSYYKGFWDGWSKQYERQKNALNHQIFKTYTKDPSIYFHYLGKPLLLTFVDFGLDFPTNDRSIWRFNNFTVRNAISWPMTFGHVRKTVFEERFFDGIDTKRFWGWGSGPIKYHYPNSPAYWDENFMLPKDSEMMSIMPGSTNYWAQNTADVLLARKMVSNENYDYYIHSWRQVIEANPKMVIINGWNEWNEETSIAGCKGQNGYVGWSDLNGNETYDWYLQITKAYAYIFKNKSLPDSIFFREYGSQRVLYLNNNCIVDYGDNYKPNQKPIIELPVGWLVKHGGYGYCAPELRKKKNGNMPTEFSLSNNYPNPFNPTTKISYSIPELTNVNLIVYDYLGREIEILVNQGQEPGYYDIDFDASKLSTGVYFVRMKTDKYESTKKMLLLK